MYIKTVELFQQPPVYTLKNLPDGRVQLAFYTSAERLESDDGERWRAIEWTHPKLFHTQQRLEERIAENTERWLLATQDYAGIEDAKTVLAERDKRLAQADYTMATDYPAGDIEREVWRSYRQALRDIPQQDNFPWEIVWPEKPCWNMGGDTILDTINDVIEAVADNVYRICLMELGLTEFDLIGDETI